MTGRSLRLTVSTWNCLADCYIDYSLGEHVGSFDSRKGLLRSVLASSDSDILLLQEADHYEDFYQPLLKELGFHASYFQRPGRKDGLVIAAKQSCNLSLVETGMNMCVHVYVCVYVCNGCTKCGCLYE